MPAPTYRVNYDLVAHLYDEPSRDYEVDPNLVKFLDEKADHPRSRIQVLDMGCGTGKQLTANRGKYPGVPMIGLDLFHGMLARARTRCPTVGWIQGDNTSPPFAKESFDYITNQFSYHHVQDKDRLMAAIFGILRPGGRFVITNLDPWSMPEWIVYTCFPAARQRDLADFLPVPELTALMQKTGFCDVHAKYGHSRTEEKLDDFLEYASQRHRTSQLIALQDHEYEAGLSLLRDRVARLGPDFRVSSEICLIRVSGDKR